MTDAQAPQAPAAPGQDPVVQSGSAAPVPAAPAPVVSDPARDATPAPAPSPAVAVTNRCAAIHATVRAWEVARFSAALAVVSTWSFAKCINNLLTGLRTIIVFGVIAFLGVADRLEGIDLTGLLTDYFPNMKPTDVMTVMSLLGIGLRVISKTPLFEQWRTGKKPGSVDEPQP